MFQHFLQPCSLPKNWFALITDTTTTYGQNGSPQVRLPIDQHEAIFDPDSQEWLPDIGESSRKALRQFLVNENKLSRNADAQTQYTEFFQEMIETGHLEPVPESDHNLPPEKHFVMPHHAVWKSSSRLQNAEQFSTHQQKQRTEEVSTIVSWLVQNSSPTFLRY